MQKIFSQEVRFKKEDGSDFPDWKEKKIKELVPAIHNLIFLHTTKEQLKEYKATTTLPSTAQEVKERALPFLKRT